MLNVDVSRYQTRKSGAPPTPADALPATSILLCLLNAEMWGLMSSVRGRAPNQCAEDPGRATPSAPARDAHRLREACQDDRRFSGPSIPGARQPRVHRPQATRRRRIARSARTGPHIPKSTTAKRLIPSAPLGNRRRQRWQCRDTGRLQPPGGGGRLRPHPGVTRPPGPAVLPHGWRPLPRRQVQLLRRPDLRSQQPLRRLHALVVRQT